jgi:hypothetical protein
LPFDALSKTLFPAQKVVFPVAVMLALGKAFTVTDVAAEVALHPPAPVTVTLKVPELFTVMDWVVAPVFQR